MPFYFLPDRYYILLVIPAMLVALWAQMRVKSTFARYSSVGLCSGLTGAQAARRILDANGLSDVRVEAVPGNLTDHYDPTQRVVRLSQDVYYRSTVAAVGVAAHETGHAVQHATGYAPLTIRNAIIPLTNIGSTISIPLVLLGFVLGWQPLVSFGILLFSLVTVFQLITLPVEFNASHRALEIMKSSQLIPEDELEGGRQVLRAAAMTYVAALAASILQLLRLLILANDRRDRR